MLNWVSVYPSALTVGWMKLLRIIVVASDSAALINGRVTLARCVAWYKAIPCACAYSTDWENCGWMSAPQPNPGYVKLWSVEIGLDSVLSTVTSCTDCGSCGSGRAIETASWPEAPGAGSRSTRSW